MNVTKTLSDRENENKKRAEKHCAPDIYVTIDSPVFTAPGRDTKPYLLHISKAIFN